MKKLSSPSEIKEILTRHGFRFSKSMGQNFLIDSSVCPKMAAASGAEKLPVLEIGPGIGVLTAELAKVSPKVLAVELDDRLLPVLSETLAEFDNVKIINGDILKLNLSELAEREFSGAFIVCANLPYYITSPVVMGLVESALPIKSITVMVQKEAAVRLCASPGERECGAVSVSVHYHSEPEILFQVSRNSFMPAPNIDSAVIRLNMRAAPPFEVKNEGFLFKLARAAFSQRRKTAANSISSMTQIPKAEIEAALKRLGMAENIRAEKITLEGFCGLANELYKGAFFNVKRDAALPFTS